MTKESINDEYLTLLFNTNKIGIYLYFNKLQ